MAYHSDDQVLKAYRNVPNADKMQLLVVEDVDSPADLQQLFSFESKGPKFCFYSAQRSDPCEVYKNIL